VAIILLGIADRLVPPDQVTALRTAIRRFLNAGRSHPAHPEPVEG